LYASIEAAMEGFMAGFKWYVVLAVLAIILAMNMQELWGVF